MIDVASALISGDIDRMIFESNGYHKKILSMTEKISNEISELYFYFFFLISSIFYFLLWCLIFVIL